MEFHSGESVNNCQVVEKDGDLVVLQEVRKGYTLDEDGFCRDTYNAYAWWGYEVECDDDVNCIATGRVIASAGNNASGHTDYPSVEEWEDIGRLDGWLVELVNNGWTELVDENITGAKEEQGGKQ